MGLTKQLQLYIALVLGQCSLSKALGTKGMHEGMSRNVKGTRGGATAVTFGKTLERTLPQGEEGYLLNTPATI